MSGYTGTQFEEFYCLPASVVKNTWTTSAVISAPGTTAVPRCLIPAGYFENIGKSIHFEANGILQATATSVTFTPAIGLDVVGGTIGGTGGATLVTLGAYTTALATTNLPWTLEGDIVAQAVGGSAASPQTILELDGEFDVSSVASGTFSSARLAAMFSASATVSNEINLFLELFAACSVSAAGNTITTKQFKVYLEN